MDELARNLKDQNIPILVYLQTAENIIDKWYRMYYKEGNGNIIKRDDTSLKKNFLPVDCSGCQN